MAALAEAVRIGVFYVALPALIGSLLHELVHAVAVLATRQRLIGLNLHHLLSNTRATVRYELVDEDAVAGTVIGLSPLGVGLAGGAAYYLAAGIPSGASGLALAIAWAFLTLNVSREDITGRSHDDGREGKAIEGLFIAGVGFAVLMVGYEPAGFIGWVLFAAGMGLAVYNMAWVIKAMQADDGAHQSGS